MRKIEKAMVAAVNGRYNWAESNTQVICSTYPDDNHTKVYVERIYLHGHEIAYRDNGKFFVVVNTLKEWNTRTTRSRLYALGFTKKTLDSLIAS